MKVSDIDVCVLRIEGTNCEQEMFLSFKRLGANPELVHLKQLIGKDIEPEEKRDLFDYRILMIPGGFSAGDYIRAGAIWAARMKSELKEQLIRFVEDGRPVGGVCNGFQVLVEMGLLPAFDCTMSDIPQAVLAINESARFECRPTFLKHEKNNCVFTRKLQAKKVIMAPSAHAEGKFLFPTERKKKLLDRLIENRQVVFRYVSPDGEYAGYPWNPNGSIHNIAGICNAQGNVFGMMPHPERVFYRWQHPDWTRNSSSKWGDGRLVFESVLDYASKKS